MLDLPPLSFCVKNFHVLFPELKNMSLSEEIDDYDVINDVIDDVIDENVTISDGEIQKSFGCTHQCCYNFFV